MTYADDPVEVYTDSMTSSKYSKDPKYHGWTKHIEICFHNVCNMVKRDEVILRYIPTNRMLVDLMTKPIPRYIFKSRIKNLGLLRIWFEIFSLLLI